MSSGSKPRIAFFGATGGCTLRVLVRSLEAGYDCSALVRTPSKLIDLLKVQKVPSETVEKHLTIYQGDVKDPTAVQAALLPPSPGAGVREVIVFGVGGTPKLAPSPLKPVTLSDPKICQEGMQSLLTALRNIKSASPGPEGYSPPLVAAISTTGVDKTRDVPVALLALYHWLLAVPHKDKKVMEDTLIAAATGGIGSEAEDGKLVGDYVIVRPSLLTDGAALGEEKVRAGYEGRKKGTGQARVKWGNVEGIAVGYTISRQDVGEWIYEEVVAGGGGEWRNQRVTLSY